MDLGIGYKEGNSNNADRTEGMPIFREGVENSQPIFVKTLYL